MARAITGLGNKKVGESQKRRGDSCCFGIRRGGNDALLQRNKGNQQNAEEPTIKPSRKKALPKGEQCEDGGKGVRGSNHPPGTSSSALGNE